MAKGTDAAGWRDTTVVKDMVEEMDTAGEKDAAEVKNKGVNHTAELKRTLETSDTAVVESVVEARGRANDTAEEMDTVEVKGAVVANDAVG
ncbi:hypothetical protein PF002_g33175 [Phytophthora fragariae]|uniref:Uncharacterized protein n=1 Tax=Phytophthora fragariae TaxID=53985 RepID=A0A6A3V3Y4_9STRA|nr:hypothetical protein PF002_g33175 [Phytophthora fragariae]